MDDGNEREQRYENIILELNKSGLSYLTHRKCLVMQSSFPKPLNTSSSLRKLC